MNVATVAPLPAAALMRADAMRVLVWLRPTMARFAPSAASASAAARPMPLVAPVIRICLLLRVRLFKAMPSADGLSVAALTDFAIGNYRRCSGEIRVDHPFRQQCACSGNSFPVVVAADVVGDELAPAGMKGRVHQPDRSGLMSNMNRSIRTRLPTCLSMGLGDFFAII
jgi:hypothetical protein